MSQKGCATLWRNLLFFSERKYVCLINVNSNSWPATIIFPDFNSMLSAHGKPESPSAIKERHDPHSAQQGGADRQDSERAGTGILRVAVRLYDG